VDVINSAGVGGKGFQWLTGDGGSTATGMTNISLPAIGSKLPTGTYQSQTGSVFNQLLQQARQGTTIDPTDPNFRMQADTYAAALERARRDQIADNAERMSATGLAGSGAESVQDRLINERSSQAQAGMEADLMGRELMNRRQEIQSALTQLLQAGQMDQARALQWQLGLIDAQLRKAGLLSGERLANNQMGIDLARMEADNNYRAMLALLGGGY
jgi:hypothetical protein